jgi:PAS domain S-box-containing protein
MIAGSTIRVLLADGTPADRRRVAALLRRAGEGLYDVTEAATAAEAAAALEHRRHDVCLLLAPVVTRERLELLERVRRNGWAAPIVVVGPESAAAWAVKGRDLGADLLAEPGLDARMLAGALRQATERSRLAHALWESEQRFRLLADNAHDAVLQLSPEGTVLYASPACRGLAGYAPERLVGRSFYEAVVDDDLAHVCEAHAALIAGRSPCTFVFRLRGRGGRVLWAECTARATRDPLTGDALEIQASVRDVSARRRSDEEIRLLGSAVQQSSEALFITTAAAPDEEPVIVFVNEAFTRMTGYAPEQAIGRSAFLLCGPATEVPPREELRADFARGEVVRGESLLYRRDGSTLVAEWQLVPIRDEEGRLTHHLAIHRDVTEQRELEQRLRQKVKMEAVGRLAGGVAHDFNNLLTAILGYADLLDDGLGAAHPAREDVAEIRRAAERAGMLTRQLLAFSRMQVLRPRVLDANGVVRETERMLGRLIGADVELRTALAAAPCLVKADPGQLEQVLVNLAVNARDAMPDGGRLLIETAVVELDAIQVREHVTMPPGRYVRLAVSDSGRGMDATTQARIFEPFFTTKERGKGTGLGLATVYGIVKQSGGWIWVASEPDRGTTFTVYLPRARGAADAAPAEDPAPAEPHGAAPEGGETVLLVEDEGSVRSLARRVLERGGYRVLAAADGREALAVARAHQGPIPLLLTDVVMPGLTGPRLAVRLRRLRPELRVLYMSGYTENALPARAIAPGAPGASRAAGFVQKPFVPEQLARAVRQALDG